MFHPPSLRCCNSYSLAHKNECRKFKLQKILSLKIAGITSGDARRPVTERIAP